MPTSKAQPAEPAENGKVLVVDDEANARNALAELPRDEGYVTEVSFDLWS